MIPAGKCFKSYFRLKAITSENVVFEVQFRIFFYSRKSHVLFLRYSFFVYFKSFQYLQSCDLMMSISTRVRVPFWMYFCHETWPNIIFVGNTLRKYLSWFGELGLKSRAFRTCTLRRLKITNIYWRLPDPITLLFYQNHNKSWSFHSSQ